MLSGSSLVGSLMVAALAVHASPSPQASPTTSATLNATSTRNATSANSKAALNTPVAQTPMRNMKTNSASDVTSVEPPTPPATPGQAQRPALEPTSLASPEPESPTTTTTAAPVVTGTKAQNMTAGATNSRNMIMKSSQNGIDPGDKKSSQSALAPISQGTFQLTIALLSVGILTIVV